MATVRAFETSAAEAETLAAVRALLDRAFRGGLTDDDWDHALGGTHVVVEVDGAAVAHGAVVARTLEAPGRTLATGYLEAVGADPDHERAGHGSLVAAALTDLVRDRFELGALSTGAHGFYERLGWERWRGTTWVRTAGGIVRTEDEDDGVMVLRTGPSTDLDLTAALTCEERPGDDW